MKPIHNNENQLSKPCNKGFGFVDNEGNIRCGKFDGFVTDTQGREYPIIEFPEPWCDAEICKCNPYNSLKMRNRWYASLSLLKHDKIESGQVHYYAHSITKRK